MEIAAPIILTIILWLTMGSFYIVYRLHEYSSSWGVSEGGMFFSIIGIIAFSMAGCVGVILEAAIIIQAVGAAW